MGIGDKLTSGSIRSHLRSKNPLLYSVNDFEIGSILKKSRPQVIQKPKIGHFFTCVYESLAVSRVSFVCRLPWWAASGVLSMRWTRKRRTSSISP